MTKKRRAKLNKMWSELETMIDEMQESLDNMPENLQGSILADNLEADIDALKEAFYIIGNVCGH